MFQLCCLGFEDNQEDHGINKTKVNNFLTTEELLKVLGTF